jgi:hypothetical protein
MKGQGLGPAVLGVLLLLSGTQVLAAAYPTGYAGSSGGTGGASGAGGTPSTGTGSTGEADGGMPPASSGGCSFGGKGDAPEISLGVGLAALILLDRRRRCR